MAIFKYVTVFWAKIMVIWRNVAWQTAHLAGGGTLYLLLWLLLARFWSVAEFGQFSFLFALIAVGGVFCDFGWDVWLIRAVAQAQQRPAILARNLLWLKILFNGLVWLVFLLSALYADWPLTVVLLLAAGMLLLSFTTLLNGVLRGLERLDWEAKIGLLQKLLFSLSAIGGVVWFAQGLLWVAFCYVISHLLAFLLTFSLLLKQHWLQIKSQSLPFSVLMKQSGPLFSVALLTVLSVRLEIFLLNYFHGETQVALYSAVIRLMDGLVIISTAYIATLFPKLVAHQQQAHFYILLRHAIMVMSSIALLLALLGYVLAPWLIQITYGAQYQSAAALLRYLLPALPMLFLTALFGQVLIAVGQQQRFMHSLLLALLCSFAIDLWAIPLWQSVGAVLAYWGREIILLFLLSFWIIHDKKTVVFAH